MPDSGNKPRILLHACCAPCSPHVINVLSADYDVSTFFYNPNIHPEEEYRLREQEILRFSEEIGFPLLFGEYEPQAWHAVVRGFEREPEGGDRCDICFRMRLERTARTAMKMDIPFFTTTLTVSPLKNADKVNAAGRA